MAEIYQDASVPIREDLVAAHWQTVEGWASPGNWWSAGERLAIVKEVRDSRAADELPPWVRPTSVDGLIDSDNLLPEAAIDAIWRLSNHSGTLTSDWHREIIERGISPEQYVELVSVVATANSLEVFASGMGLDPIALPGPAEGEPDRKLVPDTAVTSHWVPTIPGPGANVARALSSVPVAVEEWTRLGAAQYMPLAAVAKDFTWTRGALDRMQVELLAARTSLLNECFY